MSEAEAVASKETDVAGKVSEKELELIKSWNQKVQESGKRAMCNILNSLESAQGREVLQTEISRQSALRKGREKEWKKKDTNKAEKKTQRLRSFFCAYDLNSNGSIGPNEFVSFAKDLCIQMSEEEMRKTFNSVDKDNNGEIDFEEFKGWYDNEKRMSGTRKRLRRFMSKRTIKQGNAIDAAFARKRIVSAAIQKAKAKTLQECKEKHPELFLPHVRDHMISLIESPTEAAGKVPPKNSAIATAETEAMSKFDANTTAFIKSSSDLSNIDENSDGIISTEELVNALENRVDLKSSLLTLQEEQKKYTDRGEEKMDEIKGDAHDEKPIVPVATPKIETPQYSKRASLIEEKKNEPGRLSFFPFCCCAPPEGMSDQ